VNAVAATGTRSLLLWNPHRRQLDVPPPPSPLVEFHQRLPGYEPTRLVRLDELAEALGLERLWVKDESFRLGLPAFKILGVSWATYRALTVRLDTEPDWQTIEELRSSFSVLSPLTLVSATSGNHGRAVARVARWLGLESRVFVPRGAPDDRIRGIADEGAHVVGVAGTYDDAVEAASTWVARRSAERALLISDAAISASEQVPAWICDGYSTLFGEVDAQLTAQNEPPPDLVLVQIGVGSLASAAVTHFRRAGRRVQPTLVGVEPVSAACVLESARVGKSHTVEGPHNSSMFCLNAGRPTAVGVASILGGFDAFAAVGDELVGTSARALARAGVLAGPTGVAGLVGLQTILPHLSAHPPRRVLLLNTEGGAADLAGYARALQEPPMTSMPNNCLVCGTDRRSTGFPAPNDPDRWRTVRHGGGTPQHGEQESRAERDPIAAGSDLNPTEPAGARS
jgi:diaminopropionate ammonia-lyase